MKIERGFVSNIKIAYLGGGSLYWLQNFMVGLSQETHMNGEVRLFDLNSPDGSAVKANEQLGNAISKKTNKQWTYKAADSLETALDGADFVLISILPGSFDDVKVDIHLPEKYGIYQSTGENTGVGGIMRALRAIPIMQKIALAIKQHTPEAWVINLTTPLSLSVRALYHAFPQIKALGLYRELACTQQLLCNILERETGMRDVRKRDININIKGIGHFSWIDYAVCKGTDLLPMFSKFVQSNFDEGITEDGAGNIGDCFVSKNRVKFDLFRKYGYIAASSDRCMVEFLDSSIYLKNPETVERWGFSLTPAQWHIDDDAKRRELGESVVAGDIGPDIGTANDSSTKVLRALCGLERMVSNVNLPNADLQIPGLPKESIVETNALIEYNSIRPVYAGPLPKVLFHLFVIHTKNHELVMQSALDFDRRLVAQALKTDPMTRGKIPERELDKLVNEMIRATLKSLPEGWRTKENR